jgi:predicted neutral ceramidase superfamily lipid hydrolase
MTADQPGGYHRTESKTQRFDRQWNELLQEMRVMQTGVQVLTGFLLTIPFQQRFEKLSQVERRVYIAAVGLAALATLFLIAPVAMHRMLFRRGERDRLLPRGHRCAVAGLILLAAAVAAAMTLIVDVVFNDTAGWVVGGVALLLFGLVWWAWPMAVRCEVGGFDD